jgi:hypothetical protein
MKCIDAMASLDDLAEGGLSESRRIEVERHIESCRGCRAESDRAKALFALVDGLPRDIAPPHDPWTAIKGRIEHEKPGRAGMRGALPYLAAAAALVLGLSGSLLLPGAPWRSENGRLAYRARPIPASFREYPDLAQSQATFEAARAELYAALDARKGSFSKETMKVLEKNLGIIDDAVSEIRGALEKDPGNDTLSSFLIAAYENEIRVLSQAASLRGSI